MGRKLPKEGGRPVRVFFELVGRDIADAKTAGDPAGVAAALEPALADLQAATLWLAQNGMANPNNAGAGAYAYQDLMGVVTFGWMWLKMAAAAKRALDGGASDELFYQTKLDLADFLRQARTPDLGRSAEKGRGRR